MEKNLQCVTQGGHKCIQPLPDITNQSAAFIAVGSGEIPNSMAVDQVALCLTKWTASTVIVIQFVFGVFASKPLGSVSGYR